MGDGRRIRGDGVGEAVGESVGEDVVLAGRRSVDCKPSLPFGAMPSYDSGVRMTIAPSRRRTLSEIRPI